MDSEQRIDAFVKHHKYDRLEGVAAVAERLYRKMLADADSAVGDAIHSCEDLLRNAGQLVE